MFSATVSLCVGFCRVRALSFSAERAEVTESVTVFRKLGVRDLNRRPEARIYLREQRVARFPVVAGFKARRRL
jgi:hypothetical protein